MELIDREALRRKRPFTIRGGDLSEYTEGYIDCAMDADETIKNEPTVDAVPVVRCRDCKYWGDEDGFRKAPDGLLAARCQVHNYIIDGRHTGWCPKENDFCSYGERRTDDGT